jgi:hypothetical protein
MAERSDIHQGEIYLQALSWHGVAAARSSRCGSRRDHPGHCNWRRRPEHHLAGLLQLAQTPSVVPCREFFPRLATRLALCHTPRLRVTASAASPSQVQPGERKTIFVRKYSEVPPAHSYLCGLGRPPTGVVWARGVPVQRFGCDRTRTANQEESSSASQSVLQLRIEVEAGPGVDDASVDSVCVPALPKPSCRSGGSGVHARRAGCVP